MSYCIYIHTNLLRFTEWSLYRFGGYMLYAYLFGISDLSDTYVENDAYAILYITVAL